MNTILEISTQQVRGGSRDPSPWLWNREQYHELAERGFFDGERVELIDGEILTMSPMLEPHVQGVMLASEALRPAFSQGHCIRTQFPLNLGQTKEPEPDVAIVPGDIRSFKDNPTTAVLIVEVALTSLAYDTGRKANLYSRAGITDYWVVDLVGRRLLVFRDPTEDGYLNKFALTENQEIAPLAAPKVPIRVADLLP
jgi:Uma2 family endonuclease